MKTAKFDGKDVLVGKMVKCLNHKAILWDETNESVRTNFEESQCRHTGGLNCDIREVEVMLGDLAPAPAPKPRSWYSRRK